MISKAAIGPLAAKGSFVRIPGNGVHCGERLHPGHISVIPTVKAPRSFTAEPSSTY